MGKKTKADSIPETISEVETLSTEQEEQVTHFLDDIQKLYANALPPLMARERSEAKRRLLAYKFLKARKWKSKDALDMFTSTVAFREARALDTMRLFPCAFPLLGTDATELQQFLTATGQAHVCHRQPGEDPYDACAQALQKSYVNLYHYTDKAGHPVLYDCCGQCNVKEILNDLDGLTPEGKTRLDVIVPYHIYMNEVQHHLIQYADYRLAQQLESEGLERRTIAGITVVMNAKGISLGMIQRKTVQLVRGFLDVDQKHYPEVLHRLFVINCPSIVNMAFNLIRHSLDENTRQKIVFCTTEESLSVLQKVIDKDKIPVELGGACGCPGGCFAKKPAAGRRGDTPNPPSEQTDSPVTAQTP